MADVKFAVIRAQLSNNGSNTDFTESGFDTPKAAIILVNEAAASNPSTIHQSTSIGFYDGTNEYAVQSLSDNAVGTSVTRRNIVNDHVAHFTGPTGTILAEYTASFITDGVRLAMPVDNTSFRRFATVVLLGGSDPSADCGILTCDPDENDPASVTSLSYEPDLVLIATIALTSDDGGSADDSVMAFGAALNDDPTFTQRALMFNSKDSVTTSETASRVESDSATGQLYDGGTLTWTGEVTAFSSTGFTMCGWIRSRPKRVRARRHIQGRDLRQRAY
jgi:hypothetical protein